MTTQQLRLAVYGLLFVVLLGGVVLVVVLHQSLLASNVSTDIPEDECRKPIYTAHGDYALCIK